MKAAADVCQVWQVDLRRDETSVGDLRLLNDTERERAARFHFDEDRARFIACRAALRVILGEYLQCEPGGISLLRGAHGRPALDAPHNLLDFSVSHSADLALIAICQCGPVGVDVEALRHMENALALSRRCLSTAELHDVEVAAPGVRSTTFLTCWTRKEAVLKSTGTGLTMDPRQVEVGARTTDSELIWPLNSSQQLKVRSLEPVPGYIGACATAMGVDKLELRRFDLK